ncbi:Transposase IS200 like [Reichenbachiella agariperforans]|uniref:Transposase IS200 like n=1 Tax=Reichenbachiella agariperforans TaxID=156994 RepID=A0A1M6U8D6_REIAG|nr:transposase [Reichenbachiella agariperforans]SHK65328.1 Transposase IS200 like [Reichenbachiella agariperforans]
MGRKYAIRDQLSAHSVTFTIVNWIDIFIRDIYKEVILSSLKHCQENKHLQVHAYCIMTSHIHLILSVSEGELSDVIRDFKSFTSRQIKEILQDKTNPESRREWLLWMFERAGKKNKRNQDYQFWQQHNHPIELSTNEMIDQRLEYLPDPAGGYTLQPSRGRVCI